MRSISKTSWIPLFLVAAGLPLANCSSGMKSTEFTNPSFNFAFVERVAVIPFENLSTDRQAGLRATRLFATELLASGAVDVVEQGEVEAALTGLPSSQRGRYQALTKENIIALGEELEVQALLLGSVTQSETLRSGQVMTPVVTLDARLVETETGTAVWAATHTERGSGAGAKFLGTGGEPISETTRKCIRTLIKELVE